MKLRSMTGFGRAEASDGDATIQVEIKSVNNRYLDFQCKIPRDLSPLEPQFRRELGQFVTRGSVTCQVQYLKHDSVEGELSINEPLFQNYIRLIHKASEALGPLSQINIGDFLKIPDMLTSQQTLPSPEQISAKVMPVFQKACQELVQMREHEGEVLARDLEERLSRFYPSLEKVRELIPQRQADFTLKMRERIQELVGGAIAEDRLLTEVGIIAERLDVTEERVRLKAHVDHFLETMSQQATPGKKLGFLQQEMLREINTLSNKSQYFEIQQICVGWKEDVEIIREQLANIE